MTSMMNVQSEMLVEPIRTVSRQLVRELGFMSNNLAGTAYPPSAVHMLIEIGAGRATTTAQLCKTLNLGKSGIESTLHHLVEMGEVVGASDEQDGSERLLSLTPKGQQSLAGINGFARGQVIKALGHINNQEAEIILLGLQTYVASLHAQRIGKSSPSVSQVEVVRGYEPGLIGRALEMHVTFYSQLVGFGAYFETQLAIGLADLISRIDNDRNEAWTARFQGRIVGTIFIDGQDLGQHRAHLRAFIVDNEIRGGGIGRRLLAEAVKFVDRQKFEETHLWTFQGLDAARRLYESFGFILKEQKNGNQWGKVVTEQLYVRKLQARIL